MRRLKVKRRRLNARIAALKKRNPSSANLKKLINEVNTIAYNIQQKIVSELQNNETRAVSKIKENPRYFYSFAKKFAKTKSSVSPLRDDSGILVDDPRMKAEILQAQYKQVFSDPTAVSTEECLADMKPEPDGEDNNKLNS